MIVAKGNFYKQSRLWPIGITDGPRVLKCGWVSPLHASLLAHPQRWLIPSRKSTILFFLRDWACATDTINIILAQDLYWWVNILEFLMFWRDLCFEGTDFHKYKLLQAKFKNPKPALIWANEEIIEYSENESYPEKSTKYNSRCPHMKSG